MGEGTPVAEDVVVDTHVHGPHFVPQPFRSLYRLVNRRSMPAAEGFDVLDLAGVHTVVGMAVGDRVVTRLYPRSPWTAVRTQLRQLADEIALAGGETVVDAAGARAARAAGRPGMILGVEGLDAIADHLDRLDALHELGARVVIPVHLCDNHIGTTAVPWQKYLALPVRRHRPGLTAFGRHVIRRLSALGVVIDVAHADRTTAMDIIEAAGAPVIASHSGASACQDFARYLDDEQAQAVARTGGVIGLWPYFHRGRGVRDVADLAGHARHLADLVGPEHLCIGTDMNGIPGAMDGYRGERDFGGLVRGLCRAGFSRQEVTGIAGENFLRVLEAVTRP